MEKTITFTNEMRKSGLIIVISIKKINALFFQTDSIINGREFMQLVWE